MYAQIYAGLKNVDAMLTCSFRLLALRLLNSRMKANLFCGAKENGEMNFAAPSSNPCPIMFEGSENSLVAQPSSFHSGLRKQIASDKTSRRRDKTLLSNDQSLRGGNKIEEKS